MKGFFNQILVIDLTGKEYHTEKVSDDVYKNYLGGKGLALWLLLNMNKPGVSPMSPENRARKRHAYMGNEQIRRFHKKPANRIRFSFLFGGKGG